MNRRKNLDMLLAVCVFLAALAGPAAEGATILVPADFPTIQAAIDDPCTVDGDEIAVAPATYNEAINFNGKAVRLYSIGGPEVTIIDANGHYHAVQCVSFEDANTILEGFTITDGNANGMEPNDQHGGGMFNDSSSPTVRDCIFRDNSAYDGGGMYNDSNSRPTVTNCIFFDNWADFGGGGMCNSNSSPTVTNCTFSGNFAFSGGGICNYISSPTVTNCIFWLNIPDSIYDDMGSSTTVNYSDVWGGWTGAGGNIITADPLFVDAGGGNLRVVVGSPCVDAGDNGVVTEPNDLDGNPRVVDGDRDGNDIVDMGAYESPPAPIHNITQKTCYSTIQAAINGANSGDEIEVFQGTYNEAINFNGKAITLRSSDPEDPNIVAATVIDGTGNYHVVQCVSGEDANTILEGFTITGGNANGPADNDNRGGGMYCENSSPTVTNCTFTVNTANATGGGMFNQIGSSPTVTNCTFSGNSATIGGGMFNQIGSSPTVTNCTFSGNSAWWGGGMYNDGSSPTLANCTFTGNFANSQGGGMFNDSGSPTVTNCTFSNNSASSDGGGMYNESGSSPTVTECIFSNNTTNTTSGGGMYNNNSSSPTVTNCTFTGNTAQGYGGGMFNVNSSYPTVINSLFNQNMAQQSHGGGMANYNSSNSIVINCTFRGNSAPNGEGGGMRNWASNPEVTNCILWDNQPDQISDTSSSPVVSYSDIQGGYAGTENIDADPYFVNPDSNDFHLLPDSPCLDAGDSTGLWQKGIWKDIDDKIRYFDISGVTDTGSGPVTFVDMGAYEFQCSGIGGDNNCDGVVNLKDLAILCNNWLAGL